MGLVIVRVGASYGLVKLSQLAQGVCFRKERMNNIYLLLRKTEEKKKKEKKIISLYTTDRHVT